MVQIIGQDERDDAKIVFALKQASDWINGLTGTAGTVLTGNGAATAPTFQTPAATANGFVFLTSGTAASSAQIDFTTNISSTYDEYMFVLSGIVAGTNAVQLFLRISQDAGATFKAGATDYRYANNVIVDGGTNNASGSGGDTKITFTPGGIFSSTAAKVVSGTVRLSRPLSTTEYKNICFDLAFFSDVSGYIRTTGAGAYVTDANAVNGIRFLFSSGNIAAGVIYMYGISKS